MSGEMITAEERAALKEGKIAGRFLSRPEGIFQLAKEYDASLARALALLKRVQTAFDHGAPFPADRLLRDDIDAFVKEVGP